MNEIDFPLLLSWTIGALILLGWWIDSMRRNKRLRQAQNSSRHDVMIYRPAKSRVWRFKVIDKIERKTLAFGSYSHTNLDKVRQRAEKLRTSGAVVTYNHKA